MLFGGDQLERAGFCLRAVFANESRAERMVFWTIPDSLVPLGIS
jgi:hypothetical protein